MADIKPDNILVNWTCDEEGTKTITDVALGDFNIAWECPTNAVIIGPHAVGNHMWRSPEAQTGRGMSKASDVLSFGLVVSLPKLFSCIIISELTLSVSTVHIYPRARGRDTYKQRQRGRQEKYVPRAKSITATFRVLWATEQKASQLDRRRKLDEGFGKNE